MEKTAKSKYIILLFLFFISLTFGLETNSIDTYGFEYKKPSDCKIYEYYNTATFTCQQCEVRHAVPTSDSKITIC